MATGGGFASLIGNPAGEAAAFAGGLAIHPLLRPIVQKLENETWGAYPDKPTPAGVAATLSAQQNGNEGENANEAALSGFGNAAFAAMVEAEIKAPGVAEALELWRRELISQAQVVHALKKAQIDPQYHDAILELFSDRLDPAVIAVAIQRGIMQDPGFLPVGPPAGAGVVKPFPVSPLDPIAEAKASGISEQRLFVETAIVGNPASPDLAARMDYRGIIEHADYLRAIAEGNTRNEWAEVLYDGFREIPTARDFVESHLRGWITAPQMYAGTALHGMSQADTDTLFKLIGRPIPVHQVTTGEARGGTYDGPIAGIPQAFLKSLQEGNQRPEWYNLSYANRFTIPSYFVLRALGQAGKLTTAQLADYYRQLGWPPELADLAAADETGGAGATIKKETESHLAAEYEAGHITEQQFTTGLLALGYDAATAPQAIQLADFRATKKYRDKAIAKIGTRYMGLQLTDAEAQADLQALNVPATAIALYLRDWQLLRDDDGTTLTKGQAKKAYAKGLLPLPDTLARLGDLGMAPADAQLYLDEG